MDVPQIEQVDERDGSWEDPHPRFRVYFHGSGDDATCGWTDTYDVSGADVAQVIDWAQHQVSGNATYAIALVRDERFAGPAERGLVWLLGADGNDVDDGDGRIAHAQKRMLTRRATPIVIPLADRMPLGVPKPPSLTVRSG